MTTLMKIGLALIGLYGLALIGLYSFQRKVLYIPPVIYLTPAAVDLPQAVEVFTPHNPENLLGWWIPPSGPDAPVIMFFHGNGSAVFSNHDIYRDLHAQGFGVFALGYPGYPGHVGDTTQASLTQAAIEAYDYVALQGGGQGQMVFYGTSLGAGVAAQLSVNRKPALMILEAPFNSAAAMAQFRFPMFPSSFLTKDKFKSDQALKGADIPLLWLHGTADQVIPIQFGQKLYDGYSGPKSDMVIQGGTHVDLWYRGGRERILAAIETLE